MKQLGVFCDNSYGDLSCSVKHFVPEELIQILDALFPGFEHQLSFVRVGNLGLGPWGIVEKAVDSLDPGEEVDLVRVEELGLLTNLCQKQTNLEKSLLR